MTVHLFHVQIHDYSLHFLPPCNPLNSIWCRLGNPQVHLTVSFFYFTAFLLPKVLFQRTSSPKKQKPIEITDRRKPKRKLHWKETMSRQKSRVPQPRFRLWKWRTFCPWYPLRYNADGEILEDGGSNPAKCQPRRNCFSEPFILILFQVNLVTLFALVIIVLVQMYFICMYLTVLF